MSFKVITLLALPGLAVLAVVLVGAVIMAVVLARKKKSTSEKPAQDSPTT